METGLMGSLWIAAVAWIAIFLSHGCRTSSAFNPFVSIGSYKTLVIEDFEGPGSSGHVFAERVARALALEGHFEAILRKDPESRAARIRGRISRYDRGNAALRLRYGHNLGNARFSATVIVEDYESGELIASIKLSESYDSSDPHNRVHQDLDALAERAAQQLAVELMNSVRETKNQ